MMYLLKFLLVVADFFNDDFPVFSIEKSDANVEELTHGDD